MITETDRDPDITKSQRCPIHQADIFFIGDHWECGKSCCPAAERLSRWTRAAKAKRRREAISPDVDLGAPLLISRQS
jgi:hypothetical protein